MTSWSWSYELSPSYCTPGPNLREHWVGHQSQQGHLLCNTFSMVGKFSCFVQALRKWALCAPTIDVRVQRDNIEETQDVWNIHLLLSITSNCKITSYHCLNPVWFNDKTTNYTIIKRIKNCRQTRTSFQKMQFGAKHGDFKLHRVFPPSPLMGMPREIPRQSLWTISGTSLVERETIGFGV